MKYFPGQLLAAVDNGDAALARAATAQRFARCPTPR